MAKLATEIAQETVLAGPRLSVDQPAEARRSGLLILPLLLLLAVCFCVPLVVILVGSITDLSRGQAWYSNYVAFFASPVYWRILLQTIRISFVVTLICLLLGYAYAYLMNSVPNRVAGLLLIAVLFPFWSNVLVRTYAWTVILQDTGIINSALTRIGLISNPLPLMRNNLGVIIAMTYVLLPFMVLPLYATMRRIDHDYLKAAASLGASPEAAFWRVFLPLSKNGVLAGSLIVFVLSVGFYITPALMGGPRDTMLGEQVVTFLGELREPGLAYASSAILLALVLLVLTAAGRIVRFQDALLGE